ncbi:CsbD family protein [Nakamurella sp. YIM 132087]|uniref:CsbD family protein n=1 Tax=Nakamurella alba TaxID=2665158 RepID=A0A7K1FKI6_9ACTN|nr:CsbD family protein [Nakamurella alba]MTD14655.1 CsbD family protein [Nakamurella alba]
MSMGDKVKHAAEEAGGKVKEAAGRATNNDDLRAEGQADQASANVKRAGDKVEDAAKDAMGR